MINCLLRLPGVSVLWYTIVITFWGFSYIIILANIIYLMYNFLTCYSLWVRDILLVQDLECVCHKWEMILMGYVLLFYHQIKLLWIMYIKLRFGIITDILIFLFSHLDNQWCQIVWTQLGKVRAQLYARFTLIFFLALTIIARGEWHRRMHTKNHTAINKSVIIKSGLDCCDVEWIGFWIV